MSVDATQIKANASKHKSLRYDRIGELETKPEADISELLEQARSADDGMRKASSKSTPPESAQINLTDSFCVEDARRLAKEWALVCLAYNAKRLCALTGGQIPAQ